MRATTDPLNYRNDRILQFVIHKKFSVYRHMLLVLLLAVFILNSKDILTEPANTYLKTIVFCLLLFLFYVNMYWLIPRFIFTEKYFSYFLWIMALLSVTMLIFFIMQLSLKPFERNEFPRQNLDPHPHGPDAGGIFKFSFIFFILIAAIVAVKLFQRSIVMNQRLTELEHVTMQSELEQLKNQINPHFLFNTLNNVNVLTQTDPVKASKVLIKLSDLLHYQLYDSTMNKVFLTADIGFLEDFLNLEKIRRDNFEFDITLKGDLVGVLVPPLLFITFVENAVKHNLDAENPSYIYIFFEVNGDQLSFNCLNSKPAVETKEIKKGGLGLTNVKRRLELLLPGKHYLYIDNKQDQFRVELKLNI